MEKLSEQYDANFDRMDVCKRIKHILAVRQISIHRLATDTGISYRILCYILEGKVRLSVKRLLKIAKVLKIDTKLLLK